MFLIINLYIYKFINDLLVFKLLKLIKIKEKFRNKLLNKYS